MIDVEIGNFGKLTPRLNNRAITSWLSTVGSLSESTLKAGMEAEHTGRIYLFEGYEHQASAPLIEYPAILSGALYASIGSTVEKNTVTVGTNTLYASDLRHGLPPALQRRLMSDSALSAVMSEDRPPMPPWITWKETA